MKTDLGSLSEGDVADHYTTAASLYWTLKYTLQFFIIFYFIMFFADKK